MCDRVLKKIAILNEPHYTKCEVYSQMKPCPFNNQFYFLETLIGTERLKNLIALQHIPLKVSFLILT
jgi:hypothetical protein